MAFLFALITFILSSSYVLFIDHLLLSPRVLQKVLVVPVIIFIFVLYYSARNSWKLFTNPNDKWLFLFGGTAFIQILVLATGGLQSPFLILVHLLMIGISFLFSFAISLLFLFASFIVIFVDMSFYRDVFQSVLSDPNTILLQIISLLSIIPLAYIVSQQYHAKELVSRFLQKKVERDEAILSNVSEMIIITDNQGRILSVNDAATRTLQQSQAELLEKSLFNVLLMRDQQNKAVTKETFFSGGDMIKKPQNSSEIFTLMGTPTPERTVTVLVQNMQQTESTDGEITFIITHTNQTGKEKNITLDKARARYDALIQNIKKQLMHKQLQAIKTDITLVEKIENDTYTFQALRAEKKRPTLVRIDIAQLCKQTVLFNQDFAKRLGVQTNFAFHNFGEKDLDPLAVKSGFKAENMTGPFFTVTCDTKKIEIIIAKMLDLAVFLSSPLERNVEGKVSLGVQPSTDNAVIITLSATCPPLTQEQINDLFVPYYDTLASKTNVGLGSGLEGALIKELTDRLGLKIMTQKEKTEESQMVFTLKIPKKPL